MCKDIKIVLIGAGNIGSRYLQGLAKLNFNAEIIVFDISKKALEIAEDMVKDTKNTYPITYKFINSFNKISGDFDLAIISTTSSKRVEIIKDLKSNYKVDAWILEKVLAQSIEELNEIIHHLDFSSKVWVNTPRRIMPWYKNIKDNLNKSGTVYDVEITGGGWGLACNSIHFIDVFSWINESKVKSVYSNEIKSWFPSKRNNYFEAIGSIKIIFNNESSLKLFCKEEEEEIKISINTTKGRWNIYEEQGIAFGPNKEILKGEIVYQSAMTSHLVEEIITTGKCNLPNISESTTIHIKMIESFLNSWNNINGCNDSKIKIT